MNGCCLLKTAVKADVETLQAAARISTTAIDPTKSTDGLICSLASQPYAKSLLESSAVKSGNALGLSANACCLINLHILTYWSRAEDDTAMQGAMNLGFGATTAPS